MQGNKIQGIGKPFSEIKLHLAAYLAREDINAVVHSHPPFSMARGLIGGDFQISVPEAIVSIGDVIPVAKYAIPGDGQHETIITSLISQYDLFMMAGNGVFSTGRNLKEAYLRTELLEHLLKIDYYASSMGEVMSIPEEDKKQLLKKRTQIGLGPKKIEPKLTQDKQKNGDDLLKDLITEEIKKVLKEK
jgi:L-fuculose-phosphate aldolase